MCRLYQKFARLIRDLNIIFTFNLSRKKLETDRELRNRIPITHHTHTHTFTSFAENAIQINRKFLRSYTRLTGKTNGRYNESSTLLQ